MPHFNLERCYDFTKLHKSKRPLDLFGVVILVSEADIFLSESLRILCGVYPSRRPTSTETNLHYSIPKERWESSTEINVLGMYRGLANGNSTTVECTRILRSRYDFGQSKAYTMKQ